MSLFTCLASALSPCISCFRPRDSQDAPPIARSLTRVRTGGIVWITPPPAPGTCALPPGIRRPAALHASKNVDPFYYLLDDDPACDTLPTLRASGQEIKILVLADGVSPHEQEIFDIHVLPFIRADLTGEERHKLAETDLYVAKYTEEDLSRVTDHGRWHAEQYLVGQDKLVARNDLPKKTCIGVLRGEIYDDAMKSTSDNTSGNRSHYPVPAGFNAGGDRQFLLADGILSRANTNIEIDCRHRDPIDNSPHYYIVSKGHNLEAKKFAVETDSPKYPKVVITALFTTEDIAADTELRYPYDRLTQDIKWCVRGHSPAVRLPR